MLTFLFDKNISNFVFVPIFVFQVYPKHARELFSEPPVSLFHLTRHVAFFLVSYKSLFLYLMAFQ